MNHLQATLTQSRAMASINTMKDADKFLRRLHRAQRPLGTVNDTLEAYLLSSGFVRRQEGRLLELTNYGRKHARELERELPR